MPGTQQERRSQHPLNAALLVGGLVNADALKPQTGHRSPCPFHGLTPMTTRSLSMRTYSMTVRASASAWRSILFMRQGLSRRLFRQTHPTLPFVREFSYRYMALCSEPTHRNYRRASRCDIYLPSREHCNRRNCSKRNKLRVQCAHGAKEGVRFRSGWGAMA